MSLTENNEEYLRARIKALETENERLNNEIMKAKSTALSLILTDPNFDKPISEIDVNYEIINPK